MVEFVYDEVFVEIASNTKKNSTIRNKSTVDEKRKENKHQKGKAEQKETNSVAEKGEHKEDNIRKNMIEEHEKGSQSNMKETTVLQNNWTRS